MPDRTRRSTIMSCTAGVGGLALMIAGIAVPYEVVPPGDDPCFFCAAPPGAPTPRPAASSPVGLATTGVTLPRPTVSVSTTTAVVPPPSTSGGGVTVKTVEPASHSSDGDRGTPTHPGPQGQDGDEQHHRQHPQHGMPAGGAQRADKSPHGPHRPKS